MQCWSALRKPSAPSLLFVLLAIVVGHVCAESGAGQAGDKDGMTLHLSDVFGDVGAGQPLNLDLANGEGEEAQVRAKRAPAVITERDTAAPADSGSSSSTGTDSGTTDTTSGTTTGSSSSSSSSSSSTIPKNAITGYILMSKPLTKDVSNLYYWARGSTMNLTWNCYGAIQPSTVSIYVQRLGTASGGGGQLTPVIQHTGNTNGYTWNIPSNWTVGTYMVFVEDDANPVISNSSIMSQKGYCQPYSSYNPYLAGIYQPLDYTSLLYLVNSAGPLLTASVVGAAALLTALSSALLMY